MCYLHSYNMCVNSCSKNESIALHTSLFSAQYSLTYPLVNKTHAIMLLAPFTSGCNIIMFYTDILNCNQFNFI